MSDVLAHRPQRLSPAAPRLEGSLCGVRLPRRIPTFDCRIPEPVFPYLPSVGGRTLWSGERAAYALGLWHDHHYAMPVSVQCYTDLRKLLRAADVRDMRGLVARQLVQWRRNKRQYDRQTAAGWRPDGGGITYRPVCLEISNYGYSVLADKREAVTL